MPDEPPTPPGQPTRPGTPSPEPDPTRIECDVCGSDRLQWRSCKLICANCRTILKSCADL